MRRRRKGFYRKVFIVICLGAFLFASYKLIDMAVGYYKNSKVIEEVQGKFYQDAPTMNERELVEFDPDLIVEEEEVDPSFEQLLKENADVKGWIKVEGTKIDYPILQGADNLAYLRKNYYKEYSPAGSIFLDFRNDVDDLDNNTVIYGHRMKDGSMFEPIVNYEDEDFLKNNPVIELETLHGSYEAEVFAAYETTTDFNYIQTEFSSAGEFGSFLSEINKKSVIESDVDVNEGDKIITLSTCDYNLDPIAGRFAVHAKLIEK